MILLSLSFSVQSAFFPGVPHCYKLFGMLISQDSPDSKLCASVLTVMFYGNTVRAHNKQGGRGRHVLPD